VIDRAEKAVKQRWPRLRIELVQIREHCKGFDREVFLKPPFPLRCLIEVDLHHHHRERDQLSSPSLPFNVN